MLNRLRYGSPDPAKIGLLSSKLTSLYGDLQTNMLNLEALAAETEIARHLANITAGTQPAKDNSIAEIRDIDRRAQIIINRVKRLEGQIRHEVDKRNYLGAGAVPAVEVRYTPLPGAGGAPADINVSAATDNFMVRLNDVTTRLTAAKAATQADAPDPANTALAEARRVNDLMPFFMRAWRVPQGWVFGVSIPLDANGKQFFYYVSNHIMNTFLVNQAGIQSLVSYLIGAFWAEVVVADRSSPFRPPVARDLAALATNYDVGWILPFRDLIQSGTPGGEVGTGISVGDFFSVPMVSLSFAVSVLKLGQLGYHAISYWRGNRDADNNLLVAFHRDNPIRQSLKNTAQMAVASAITTSIITGVQLNGGTPTQPVFSAEAGPVLNSFLPYLFLFAVAMVYMFVKVTYDACRGHNVVAHAADSLPAGELNDAARLAALQGLYDALTDDAGVTAVDDIKGDAAFRDWSGENNHTTVASLKAIPGLAIRVKFQLVRGALFAATARPDWTSFGDTLKETQMSTNDFRDLHKILSDFIHAARAAHAAPGAPAPTYGNARFPCFR